MTKLEHIAHTLKDLARQIVEIGDEKNLADRRLTVPQVAEMLNVTNDTVRRWHKEGRLVGERLSERGYRYYTQAQVEAFIIARDQKKLKKVDDGLPLPTEEDF